MNRYDLCPSCSRHIKRADTTCPFCGAHKSAATAWRAGTGRRMSRAELLAVGSAMVLGGCSGKELTTAPDGATSVTSVSLGFECGDAHCAPAGEFCLTAGPPLDLSYLCQPYDDGGWAPGDAACGTYPTCACSTWSGPYFGDGVCGCTDNDAGAVTVTACHSCYGAPPARLELLT
jgi:hypothetical protein